MARENTSFSEVVGVLENTLVAEEGLERGPSFPGKTPFLEDGNAPSDALTVDDAQLQLLIERWPTLSKAVQQQIMLLVG